MHDVLSLCWCGHMVETGTLEKVLMQALWKSMWAPCLQESMLISLFCLIAP
jgi:hypothetical protein